MHWQNDLLFASGFFQAFDVPVFPNSRRQIVGDDAVFFAAPDSGHQKNARPNARAAQRATFGCIGYSEPRRAFGLERERTFGCAVSITVGFYDRADCDVFADMSLHDAKIFAQRVERNFRPGAAVQGERAAIGQNYAFEARSVHSADYNERNAAPRLRTGFVVHLRNAAAGFNVPTQRPRVKFTVISVSTAIGSPFSMYGR